MVLKNRNDLEQFYAENYTGNSQKTFLRPDLEEILDVASDKRMKDRGKKGRDEFDHMINWRRVFQQIWTQIRWL